MPPPLRMIAAVRPDNAISNRQRQTGLEQFDDGRLLVVGYLKNVEILPAGYPEW